MKGEVRWEGGGERGRVGGVGRGRRGGGGWGVGDGGKGESCLKADRWD